MAFPKVKKPILVKPVKETRYKIGEKAKRPKPGIPLKKDTILKLIVEHDGNLSRVAEAMGTTRGCVRRHCQADAELGKALEDARERMIDELESSCFEDAINNRDTGLRCFLLKTQGRHRGYEQDDMKNHAHSIATAAFDFITNKTKNPAEPSTP